ncbi:MAG: hypothetical protein ACLFST_09275 [Spirochaetia bacterium]
MELKLGIKSDPIEYRYSFEWLFRFMRDRGIRYLQLGSFFELYTLDLAFFSELRESAEKFNIRIKSCFTAHRELGGFFTGNRFMEACARRNYEEYIRKAAVLGADYCGSNPGAVYRDKPKGKEDGIRCYLEHMGELLALAKAEGLKGLTIEPMSSQYEPPSLPEEIISMVTDLGFRYRKNPDQLVPPYLCGDISHGIPGKDGTILFSHLELFELSIPFLAEFHLKNTDTSYHSTFGFSKDEQKRGIVDLREIAELIDKNREKFPVEEVVAYLELGGPKLGRDDTDYQLERMLDDSLQSIGETFRFELS